MLFNKAVKDSVTLVSVVRMSMEHWWNDADRKAEVFSTQKPASVAHCPHGLVWDWVTMRNIHGAARELW